VRVAERLARRLAPEGIAVAIDGGGALAAVATPVATLRLARPSVAVRLLVDPEVAFGECWTNGDLWLEGDLVSTLEAVFRRAAPGGRLPRPPGAVARLRRRLGGGRRGAGIAGHYDLGNAFYRSWLDPSMTYTCAYWECEAATLAEAQQAKLERVCRKLALRPGETVLEAGCGWGSLAVHMARHHGVRVRAFNVSAEQVDWARERVREQGLEGRVEIVHDDARNAHGSYDAFVAVGMFEALRPEDYPGFGRALDGWLAGGGRGLLHTIGRPCPWPTSAWIDRHVFPGGYTPSLAEALQVLEPHGFVVTDVENLRRHYVRTLECWLASFESVAAAVAAERGEPFARLWTLYLASAIAGFRSGWLQLFQIVFERPAAAGPPRARGDLMDEASCRRP
jgi:cyclopropane-fatty-acyl-phospholipid synthase